MSASSPPPRPRRFTGLVEGVRRLLERPPAPAPQTVASEPGAAVAASTEVAAGQFSLVGLTEIRDALGARWEKVAPKVHALAEAVLSSHLRAGDVFERVGDDT